MISRTVRASDGVSLALHRLDPAAATGRPPVLLAHGAFTSHRVWLRGGKSNTGLAPFLLERGHDVWLGDWRHHGASEREPRAFHWHFEDVIQRDAAAFLSEVRRETGSSSCTWIGHSVGGTIGMAVLARDPALGPSVIVTLGTPGPVMSPSRRAFALTTIGICRVMGRFPARLLRLGSEDEPALVLSEWMSWNLHGAWIGQDGFDYLAALKRDHTPWLSIAGLGDTIFAPAKACRALVEQVRGDARDFAVVGPGLTHRGLLLDSRADEECWPRLARWVERAPAALTQ
jgi:oxygen-independent coproporphyrinogen-3 oxidase